MRLTVWDTCSGHDGRRRGQRQSVSCVVFFFSSRRRHTRCSRDWSSDVCSSDLTDGKVYVKEGAGDGRLIAVVIIVVLLVAGGMWLQRRLIARYRARLAAAADKHA